MQNPESKSKVQIDALRGGVRRENGQVHAGMQNPESKSKVQIDALRGVCRENGQVHAGMQNPESKSKVQIDALRGTFAISDEHDENAESGIQIQSPDGRPQGHLDQLRQGVNGGGRVQNLSTEYRFFAYRSLLQGVTTRAMVITCGLSFQVW